MSGSACEPTHVLLPQRSMAQTSLWPFAAFTPAVEPHERSSGSGITRFAEYGFGRSLTGAMFGLPVPAGAVR
jgi:hypothetical protein